MKRDKFADYLKKVEDDKRWVIPSCDVRYPFTATDVRNRESIKYWSIELTLTSGEVRNFYVKAKTHYDAQIKAYDNIYRADLSSKNGTKLILID